MEENKRTLEVRIADDRLAEYAVNLIKVEGNDFKKMAQKLGFEKVSQFTSFFTEKTGKTPRDYRNKYIQTRYKGALEMLLKGSPEEEIMRAYGYTGKEHIYSEIYFYTRMHEEDIERNKGKRLSDLSETLGTEQNIPSPIRYDLPEIRIATADGSSIFLKIPGETNTTEKTIKPRVDNGQPKSLAKKRMIDIKQTLLNMETKQPGLPPAVYDFARTYATKLADTMIDESAQKITYNSFAISNAFAIALVEKSKNPSFDAQAVRRFRKEFFLYTFGEAYVKTHLF